MSELLRRIYRSIFPKWELRWCIATSLINPNWRWYPYQCWYRNGECDIRYAFLLVVPVDPDTEERAKEIAAEFTAEAEASTVAVRAAERTQKDFGSQAR